ncbi:MAG: phage tail protein [Acidimicrobiia bacterium]|nr:phage tail protein [Acidimicrobiia bacterium]
MAQLAFGAGGAVLGSFVGQPGLGFTAGNLLYSVVGGGAEDTVTEGPRISRQINTTSAFGVMRPIVYGTFPTQGNVIDSSPKREIKHEQKQDAGGKGFLSGGPSAVSIYYTAQIDLAIGLGEGPRDGLVRVYAGQTTIIEMVNGAVKTQIPGLNWKFYKGTDTQLPDPTLQRIHGVGETPAYRDECYLVLTDFDLEPFGNNVPPFRAITTSSGTESNSIITKDFGGEGNITGLWQDRRRAMIYHAGNSPPLGKTVDVYDAITRNLMFSMPWVDPPMRNWDEGGGCGLFSLPVLVGGETISPGPNSHFFVNIEETGTGFGQIAIFDALTGAYVNTAFIDQAAAGNNPNIAVNENSATTYLVTSGQFIQRLRFYDLLNAGGITGISILTEYVQLPFVRAQGEEQWSWDIFREGTNRQGRLAALGTDAADSNRQYIIFYRERKLYSDAYAEVTGFAGVSLIVWDSIQDLYWCMGESASSNSITRFAAFNFDGNEIATAEIAGADYLARLTMTFAPDLNGIIWITGGNIKLFNTSTLELEQLGTGAGGGSGYDQATYNKETASFWCTSGHEVNINSIGRIDPNSLTLDVPVADICRRAGLAPSQYNVTDLASVPFYGMGVDQDQPFRSVLRVLQEGYIFDGVDKADYIDFLLRGRDPEVIIPKEHLGCFNSKNGRRSDEPLVDIDNRMDLELPGFTEITYYSEALEYEQQTKVAHRWASALEENKAAMSLPLVLDDDYAAKLVDIKEHLSHIGRVQYKVKALPMYRYLCPGDVVGVTDEDDKVYIGQVIRKSFNQGFVEMTLVRDDKSAFQSFRSSQPPQPRTTSVKNNPLTFSQFIDGPLFFTSHNNMGFPVANCGFSDGWRGGNLYRSFDVGASFSLLGTFFSEAVIGNIPQVIPEMEPYNYDQLTSFNVNVKGAGSIPSATLEDVLKGANHALVGNNGRWEVIGVVNSTLQPDGSYLIEPPLLRGRLGTSPFAGSHQQGDVFVLLEPEKLDYIQDSISNLNRDLTFRSASIGVNLFTGQVVDQIFRNTGECLRPYPPALFRATRNEGNQDINFTWDPRTRFRPEDFWTTLESDAPLFKLVISKVSDGTVLRTEEDFTDPFFLYTRTQQETDGLVAGENDTLLAELQHKTTALPAGSNLSQITSVEVLAGPPIPKIIQYAVDTGMVVMWEFADNITNPAPDFTDVVDYFGNHPMRTQFANNLLVFGEPGLLPGPYKTSVKLDEYGRISIDPLPTASTGIDLYNFTFSVVFEALEVRTTSEDIELLDLDNDCRIIWCGTSGDYGATGEIALWKKGVFAADSINIQTGFIPAVNDKLIITIAYWNDTSAAPGQPVTMFVNGQEFISPNNRARNETDFYVQCGYTPRARAAMRLQMVMGWPRKLTSGEISNLHKLSGLF